MFFNIQTESREEVSTFLVVVFHSYDCSVRAEVSDFGVSKSFVCTSSKSQNAGFSVKSCVDSDVTQVRD